VNVYPFIEAEKRCRRNVKRACELLKVSRAVTGVDVGYEEVGRWGPGMVAIRVHVPSKTDEVTDDQRVPAEIEGCTDGRAGTPL
jgi:hypothetical protein